MQANISVMRGRRAVNTHTVGSKSTVRAEASLDELCEILSNERKDITHFREGI